MKWRTSHRQGIIKIIGEGVTPLLHTPSRVKQMVRQITETTTIAQKIQPSRGEDLKQNDHYQGRCLLLSTTNRHQTMKVQY